MLYISYFYFHLSDKFRRDIWGTGRCSCLHDDGPPGLHLLLAALLTDGLLGLLSFMSSLKMEDFPFLMILLGFTFKYATYV